METVFFTYETQYGTGGVVSGAGGIVRHILPAYVNSDELIQAEGLESFHFKEDRKLLRVLEAYFNGEKIDIWPVALDFSDLSSFARATFLAVSGIRYGRRATYKEITMSIGRPFACRAAGNVLGRNKTPLFIPCHRVIRTGGEPGGWSGPAGWKEILLEIEGFFLPLPFGERAG